MAYRLLAGVRQAAPRAASIRAPSSSTGSTCPRATTASAGWRVRGLHPLQGKRAPQVRVRGAAGRAAGDARALIGAAQPGAASGSGRLLFVDWALSNRGQAVGQTQTILLYGSVRRTTRRRWRPATKLSDFKLLFPTGWADFRPTIPSSSEGVERPDGALAESAAVARLVRPPWSGAAAILVPLPHRLH